MIAMSPGWIRWAAAPLMQICPDPAFYDIGGQPVAVGDVDDVHLLTGQQPGGLEQGPVDRHRTDVIEIRLGDSHPVELGVEHGALHSDVLQIRGFWCPWTQ
jgi:hypothetical protein